MSKNTAPLWASQNFLTGKREIQRLLRLTDIGPSDLVLEIGPGKGHITHELLPCCKRLIAAELDPGLCQTLSQRFAAETAFSLYHGDFLKMPLPKESYKVFSNIPFSSTTAIVRRLTQVGSASKGSPPEAAWLVMELGAAKRFAGTPRESLASQSLRPFFQVRVATKISREQFHPSPRVDAALLELKRRAHPDLPWNWQGRYISFLEKARRQGLLSLLTKRQISTALRLAGLPPFARDANLEYVQWLCLFRCWNQFHS